LLAIGEYLYADIPLIVWRRSSSLTPEGHDGSVEANHHRRGSGTVASIIAYDRQVASARSMSASISVVGKPAMPSPPTKPLSGIPATALCQPVEAVGWRPAQLTD
jgi:hypothetical protein